ncbi:MAG: beta-N-acetylhexosaminidase [Candidatus Cloacimonadaceae bacterium]|nr:beta-N-acetylhexosaminidase [Candidatus Cloacimonadaceae bacterium]
MIPKPAHDTILQGYARLEGAFHVSGWDYDSLRLIVTNILDKCLADNHISTSKDEHPLPVVLKKAGRISMQETEIPPQVMKEAYRIDILEDGIELQAVSRTGLLYAVQSLKQLIRDSISKGYTALPCRRIWDYPAFSYRGLHLDVSRHFFAPEFIYRYLDWMHELKLNKFHWHLCDDQGWRIESKAFPLLHQIASIRIEKSGDSYGGYYTQEEILSIVDYAKDLGIEIIPELDIPGHAQAVLAAYPQLACFEEDYQVWNSWGVSENILCAGKDSVLEFLKQMCTELADIFPSAFIHLGGDEVPKTRWKQCPLCQKRKQELDLPDEEALQGWLIRQLALHLKSLGKELIGWDEILDTGIDSQPLVMIWRGDGSSTAARAVDNGNRHILCPQRFMYFDWKQRELPDEPGAHGINTLQNVYGYSLQAATDNSELLLGGQANLWTEYMKIPQEVNICCFPGFMPCPKSSGLLQRTGIGRISASV